MDWLRIGLLHLNQGKSGDQVVVSPEWMRAITTPSDANPNYGYLTWLGTQYEEFRYYNTKTNARVPHLEPFAAEDVIFFDGLRRPKSVCGPVLRVGGRSTRRDSRRLG